MNATTPRPVPWSVKLALLALLLGALGAIFLIHPPEAQGQGLIEGNGYNPYPARPDPWAAVKVACNWDMGPSINTPSDPATLPPGELQRSLWEQKIGDLVRSSGLTRERVLECLALGQSLYRQRFNVGPPTAGNGILEPSQVPGACGSENIRVVLERDARILWSEGHAAFGGPEYTGNATLREQYDLGFSCPLWMHCEATRIVGTLKGSTPENPRVVCEPGKPAEYVGTEKVWRCPEYRRNECAGEPEPDPDPEPEPDPEPPPPVTSCPAGQDCRPPCPECPEPEESAECPSVLREIGSLAVALLDGVRWAILPDGRATKHAEGRYIFVSRTEETKLRNQAGRAKAASDCYIPDEMSTSHLEIDQVPGEGP